MGKNWGNFFVVILRASGDQDGIQSHQSLVGLPRGQGALAAISYTLRWNRPLQRGVSLEQSHGEKTWCLYRLVSKVLILRSSGALVWVLFPLICMHTLGSRQGPRNSECATSHDLFQSSFLGWWSWSLHRKKVLGLPEAFQMNCQWEFLGSYIAQWNWWYLPCFTMFFTFPLLLLISSVFSLFKSLSKVNV